jgi:hypothetical protein
MSWRGFWLVFLGVGFAIILAGDISAKLLHKPTLTQTIVHTFHPALVMLTFLGLLLHFWWAFFCAHLIKIK